MLHHFRGVPSAALAVCLVLSSGTHAFAGDAAKATTKAGKKAHIAPAPARPSGVPLKADPVDAYYGGRETTRSRSPRNELGQTVYSIAASHFDISPPLREMAAAAVATRSEEEEEYEPSNPRLPAWRIIRSDVPDPVVQAAVQPADAAGESGVPLAAPTTGFNFLGVGDQRRIAVRQQRLGRRQPVRRDGQHAVPGLVAQPDHQGGDVRSRPASINTLWAGFGGACETQNSGDPIVIFDKTAKRWLISQFTSSRLRAASTTSAWRSRRRRMRPGRTPATRSPCPTGMFGDYPHISAWPNDAYLHDGARLRRDSSGHLRGDGSDEDAGRRSDRDLGGDPGSDRGRPHARGSRRFRPPSHHGAGRLRLAAPRRACTSIG